MNLKMNDEKEKKNARLWNMMMRVSLLYLNLFLVVKRNPKCLPVDF